MYFYGVFIQSNKKLIKNDEIVDLEFETKEIFARKYNKELQKFELELRVLNCDFEPVTIDGINWFKIYQITTIQDTPVNNTYVVFGEELVAHSERYSLNRDVYFDCTAENYPTIDDAWFYWNYVQGLDDVADGIIVQTEPAKFEWTSNKKVIPAEAWELSMEFTRTYLRRKK